MISNQQSLKYRVSWENQPVEKVPYSIIIKLTR
ncbi:hypothetical protein QFZ80_004904 [Paenibacillus sp. V4I7]|nr:hypothetical protein [Paenibacillus sp. V4I7]